MSNWELTRQKYPTKHELSAAEREYLPYTCKDSFAANLQGRRILFAQFGNEAIYSRGVGYPWKYEEDRDEVTDQTLRSSFVDYGLVDNLDSFKGTAEFRGKEIKYDTRNHRWLYLNNRPVNFHTSEHNTPAVVDAVHDIEFPKF
jgi:hypothetical protein